MEVKLSLHWYSITNKKIL